MKYQKEYDEIRGRFSLEVDIKKRKRIIELKGQLESLAIRGHSSLFDQAMDEIKQLEEELKNEIN